MDPAAHPEAVVAQVDQSHARGNPAEVFCVALQLGLTAFGGPIAHLGYFERVYVQRRRWLSADDYASLVALCQLLPGPASSQVGFLIGLRRAGWPGAFAAWLGFTLPSAVLMFLFAWLAPHPAGPLAQAMFHGLKLVAVAIVAQAVWSMGRKLCPDFSRTVIALTATSLLLVSGGPLAQMLALIVGATAGAVVCKGADRPAPAPPFRVGRSAARGVGVAFMALLIGLPLAAHWLPHSLVAMMAIFYQAGALVFGGGHVVLPLLRDALVPSGWLADDIFLSGYGAAQAVPGPLFTFAAYLGADLAPAGAGVGARALWSTVALIFLFLPGLLISVAGLRLWSWLGEHSATRGALAGVNAAVVGVLGAALYDPIWTSAILAPRDLAVALIGFVLLERWRVAPILIVALCVMAAMGMAALH